MDKQEDNTEVIKKYTRELRNYIENDGMLLLNELKQLQEKYVLTRDDIDKVEDIAIKLFEKAKTDYDFGDWDSALTNIEEAAYKSPFNLELLILHIQILIENNKISEKNNNYAEQIEPLLKRLQQVDKKEFKNISNSIKQNNKKKINKLWLLLLLLLIIPLFFIFISKNNNKNTIILPKPLVNQAPINGIIPVNIKKLVHPSELHLDIIESKLNIGSNNFLYTLKFEVSSAKENLIQVHGDIIWFDRNGLEIFRDVFIAGKSEEFFINEKIPVIYNKSSLRGDPDLYDIEVKINEIISLPGRERDELDEIEYILPDGQYRELLFKKAKYTITEGVISNYLSLSLIVENRDSRPIKELLGSIIWVDDYDIVHSKNELILITTDDITLLSGAKRTIHKTIELDKNITPDYKIEIERIK